MSDPTNQPTPDDDALRRLGVRHVLERAADGTVSPRDLGGQPAPAPDAAVPSLQPIPECSDCVGRREEVGRYCQELGYPPGRPLFFKNPGGGYCYCLCP
jgi:hypothetical protein